MEKNVRLTWDVDHKSEDSSFSHLIIVFQTLLVLNLADDLDVLTTIVSQKLAKVLHVGALSHKTGGDEVNIVLDSEVDNIVDVLFGERRKVNDNTRQVHVLSFTNRSIVFDTARDFAGRNVTGKDRQDEGSIGHQNLLSRSDRLGKRLVRARQLFVVPLERVVRSQDQGFSLGEGNLLAFGKEARANLGSLGVEQDGCGR